MFNWYDTKNLGLNWYEYVPPVEEDTDSTTPIEPIVSPETITSAQMFGAVREQQDEDPNIIRMRRRSQTGRLDLMNAKMIGYTDIKYGDFNEYLKEKGLPDRSGFFANTHFPTSEKGMTAMQGAGIAGGLTGGNPFMGLMGGFIGAESQIVADPTGEYNRGIPKTGIGNPLASIAISSEYAGLGKIRDAWSANPMGSLQENGFAFNLGGVTVWRDPNSNRYSGQLDRIGLDQRTARDLENLMVGRELGDQLVNNYLNEDSIPFFTDLAIAAGMYPDSYGRVIVDNVQGFDFDNIVLGTKNGGYTLDGRFNFKGQMGRNGRMEDFDDLVDTVFDGNKDAARSWLNTSRSTQFESAADKIQNLQYFILKSRGFEHVTAMNMISTAGTAVSSTTSTTKTTSTTAPAPSAPAPQPAAGPTGDDRFDQPIESGTSYVNVPGVGFVSPERAAQIQREGSTGGGDDSAPAGRSYSVSYSGYGGGAGTPSGGGMGFGGMGFRAEGGPILRQEGGDVPADPEGFVRGAPRPQPEDSIVSRDEAQRPAPESGFVVRPPSQVSEDASIADDIDMEPEVGGEVINASAVSIAGEKDIYEMIEDAKKYRKNVKGVDKPIETSNIRISEGEVYVDPELADIIGRDKIRKINERGVPATKKKQQRSQRASRGTKVS